MNDLGVRILIAMIGAVATLAAAWISHDLTAKEYAREVERLTTEREACRHEREQARRELTVTKTSLKSTQLNLAQLKTLYTGLELKYRRCVSPKGKIFTASYSDPTWHEETVATGDSMEFKLVSSSILLSLLRVTKDGPVFQIKNCAKPGILSAVNSSVDGEQSYLIGRGQKLEVAVSSECCEQGLATCDTADLDNIVLECLDYDTDKQKSNMRFKRSPMVSGG